MRCGGGGKRRLHTVVGFVHQTHDDLCVTGVLRCQLTPQIGEVVVGRPSALANDGSIPASVVVNVYDAVCTGFQAPLDQLVVSAQVAGVQGCSEGVLKILPGDGETEDVELVDLGKVGHLTGAISAATP